MTRTWIAIVALVALAACERKPSVPGQKEYKGDLTVMGDVPAFDFLSSDGTPVTNADLKGKVWVASFIYTSCTSHCPIITAAAAKLQETFAREPGVRLVSFTVDPTYDTTEVLARFARDRDAEPGKWIFLWNRRERIKALVHDGFVLPWDDEGVNHSLHMVLVDQEGRIRGYFDAQDGARMDALAKCIRKLLAEP
jgi:protein SCO1/2